MQAKSQKIRLLFIVTALHKDGALLSTLTTLKHLDKRYFEPRLFVLKQLKSSEQGTSWKLLLQDVNVVFGEEQGLKSRGASVKLFKRLYHCARHSDIIIGGLEMAPTFLAVIAGKLLGKPSVGFIRNSLPDLFLGLPASHKILTRTIYPYLTRAIAISNGIKAGTERLIPGLKGRISTVYIPIDIERISEMGSLPLSAGSDDRPYILGVGRLMPQKGFDILLHAYALAREQGLQHRLVIVGEGRERLKLESLIKDLQLSEHVLLAGFQENPYSWMKGAELFVSSSRFEGFCRVLAEAQALGTPVVSTDCPDGPAEVLQNGESGILVGNENADALAAGIISLINDKTKMQEFSVKGIERVEEFTFRNTIGSFEKILMEIYQSRYKSKGRLMQSV